MKASQSVLDFWFQELKPSHWYEKSPALDQQIVERFGDLHAMAVAAELFSWRVTPEGRVAELIFIGNKSIKRLLIGMVLDDAQKPPELLLISQVTIELNRDGLEHLNVNVMKVWRLLIVRWDEA